MDCDQSSICDFLKGFPGQFVPPRLIARRVGGKERYLEDPRWAIPVLKGLLRKGILEVNAHGHYRLQKEEPTHSRNRLWLCPQIARLLQASRMTTLTSAA